MTAHMGPSCTGRRWVDIHSARLDPAHSRRGPGEIPMKKGEHETVGDRRRTDLADSRRFCRARLSWLVCVRVLTIKAMELSASLSQCADGRVPAASHRCGLQ